MKQILDTNHSNDTSLLKSSLLFDIDLKVFFSQKTIFLEFIHFLFKMNN